MKKAILVILDGWGINEENVGNAISNASTPNINLFKKFYFHTSLQASGVSVGLPWGRMGNSEVGHLILGAGKILYQNLPRVSLAIQERTFFKNEILLKTIIHAIKNNSNIHLMGLVSDGGVHSHIDHLYALLELLKASGIDKNKVFIHIFTDGRDTNPRSAVKFVSDLIRNIEEENWPGKIASITGRYYAMDRNKNWDRTKLAYYCLVNGVGRKENDPVNALEKYYAEEITDEFIKPTLITDENNNFNLIKENDSVIFFNIREDRARQLTKSFAIDNFSDFDRGKKLSNLHFTTMMEYKKGLPVNVVFPAENVEYPLGRVLSEIGIKQLRIAETEKYAHVTYFFNGGKEKPFKNEYRIIVPSKQIASYDQDPEMSAKEITDQVIKKMESGVFNFILVNYANPDMVGHTGNYKATIKAIEFVDQCLGRLYKSALENSFVLIVTADHGNAEETINPKTGEKITEHTTNPVPFMIVSAQSKLDEEKSLISSNVSYENNITGMLCDVAPTVLDIMEIKKPDEMTGKSLLS
ncbi:MAG: 2,3-bisphosphoglycerate-independent phosphoglycerate mutase [Candidatus Pacebacteria bacterium]|nr:2,3-bisphosphoglycerate-independent phosphoglycerate mutase [Candidatus Paceibacterota bacterium]